MSHHSKFWLVTLAIIFIVITGGAMVGYQDKDLENTKLENRVDSLEKRIEQLELVLFSTSKLSVLRAERRLAEAEENLKNTESLMLKGVVNQVEVDQARFDVREAYQELKLAKTENRQKELTSNLEFIKTERRLKDAVELLRYKKQLYDRGFVSKAEIDRLQRDIDIRQRAVDNARMKLEAAKNLEGIKNKDNN